MKRQSGFLKNLHHWTTLRDDCQFVRRAYRQASHNGGVMSEAVLKRMVILANLVQFEHEVTEGERPVVFLFL